MKFGLILFGFIALLKVALALLIPVTGDEAYFTVWTRALSGGYYDHPPMIGWLLWLSFQIFGKSIFALRLPALLITVGIALGIFRWLLEEAPRNPTRARLGVLLFLVSPLQILGTFSSTDTALAGFVFLSGYLWDRALRTAHQRNSWIPFAGSGLAFGLAFLSKYFALWLLPAFTISLFYPKHSPKKLRHLLAFSLAAVPAVFFHLAWNWDHCWINVVFNAVSRQRETGFSLSKPLEFLGFQLYLATPVLLAFAFQARRGLRQPGAARSLRYFGAAFCCFLLSSFRLRQSLQWMMPFYPFLIVGLTQALSERQLRRATGGLAAWTGVHLAIAFPLLGVIHFGAPERFLKGRPNFASAMLFLFPEKAAQALLNRDADFYATGNYTWSALFEFAGSKPFHVLGSATHFGRQDELWFDPSSFQGRNGVIFDLHGDVRESLARYFVSTEPLSFTLGSDSESQHYEAFLGRGFLADKYVTEVIPEIRARYYQIPTWLPKGQCYLDDRHGRAL